MPLADVFSTRELAWLIWGNITLIATLFSPSIRSSLWSVVKIFFQPKLFGIWLLMVFYIVQISFLLWYFDLWDGIMIKDTIFFILFSASVTFFKANKIDEDKHFFKEMIKDNLKVGIFLEFLIGLYTFNFVAEFIAVPITVLFGSLLAVAKGDSKYLKVKKLINAILTIVGIYTIYHVINAAIHHYKELFALENLKEFLFAPVYTLLYIPFLYLLSMYMVYETQNVILGVAIKEPTLKALAKEYAFRFFRNDLAGLKRWVRRVRFDNPQTEEELIKSITDLKNHLQLETTPPAIASNQGWSPYQAINFLDHEKLKAGIYDRYFDDEWGACSGYLYIGDNSLTNTISYYVNGDETIAKSLDLALKVFRPNEPADLHKQFLFHVKVLFEKATSHTLPENLAEIIMKGNPGRLGYQHYLIELKKERWRNVTHGYDLVFTISLRVV
ncbi:hypothetical protein ACFJIV_26720 [Mucilaginibacter sp. UC70_90]